MSYLPPRAYRAPCRADDWICWECLSQLSWFARCSASYRQTAHASYLQAWQTLRSEQRADRLLLRSFSRERWAALEAAGV